MVALRYEKEGGMNGLFQDLRYALRQLCKSLALRWLR